MSSLFVPNQIYQTISKVLKSSKSSSPPSSTSTATKCWATRFKWFKVLQRIIRKCKYRIASHGIMRMNRDERAYYILWLCKYREFIRNCNNNINSLVDFLSGCTFNIYFVLMDFIIWMSIIKWKWCAFWNEFQRAKLGIHKPPQSRAIELNSFVFIIILHILVSFKMWLASAMPNIDGTSNHRQK